MSIQVKGSQAGGMDEINVTPLIDVVLVLLIIFMVLTPLTVQKMANNLPPPDEETPPPPPDSPVLTQSTQISTQTQRDDPVMILKSLTMLSDLVRILFRTNFFLPPLETQSSSVIVIVGSNRERDRDNRD